MEIGITLNHHNLKSDKQGNLALNLIGGVVLVVSFSASVDIYSDFKE